MDKKLKIVKSTTHHQRLNRGRGMEGRRKENSSLLLFSLRYMYITGIEYTKVSNNVKIEINVNVHLVFT